MFRKFQSVLALGLLLATAGNTAQALTPLTGTFSITHATSNLHNPRVVVRDDGSFVVAYEREYSSTDFDVYVQRFSAAGVKVGNPIAVDQTILNQRRPVPALLPSGGFAVAYLNESSDIVVKRYSAAGGLLAGTTTIDSTDSAVGVSTLDFNFAVNAAGKELVAWSEFVSGNSSLRVRAVVPGAVSPLLLSEGAAGAVSPKVRDIDVTEDDGFFVHAVQVDALASSRVFLLPPDGASFTSAGTPSTSFSYTDAAVLPGANYVLSYPDVDPDDTNYEFLTLDVVAFGDYVASRSRLTRRASVFDTRIDADLRGNMVAAWYEEPAPYRQYLIRHLANGTTEPLAALLSTNGMAIAPFLDLDGDGDLVAVWEEATTLRSIQGRRFRGTEPVDLALTQTEVADPAPTAGPVQYRITVRNKHAYEGAVAQAKGLGWASGISVVDTLPEGSSYLGVTGTGWTCTAASGIVTCSFAGALKPQAATTLTLSITPPAGSTGSEIVNQATVYADQLDPLFDNNDESESTGITCAPGSLAFGASAYAIAETGGSATISVSRTAGCGAASVQLATRDDSAAVIAQDYRSVAEVLSWADGEGGLKTVQVPILDDSLDEADETLRLVLRDASGAPISGPAEILLTIQDDELAPLVVFERTLLGVAEAEGTLLAVLRLSAVSGRDVTVALNAVDGTAAGASDYELGSASVVIPAGATRLDVPIGIDPDVIDEVDEGFRIEMGAVTAARIGRRAAVDVTILDDDEARVLFAVASSTVGESAAPRAIAIKLSTPSSRTVTVPFSVAGTATLTADYTIDSVNPVSFSAGVTTRNLILRPVSDVLVEGNETMSVTLGAPTNATLGSVTAHVQTLVDDD